MTVSEIVFQVWIFGEFMCKITGYLQGIYVGASVLTIVCMSADRFVAIRYPMKNRQIFTVTKTKQLIGITWLLAIAVMVPLILVRKVDHYDLVVNDMPISYCVEQWPSHNHRQIYDIFLFCFIYIIPGTVVLLLYSLIGCRLWVKDARLGRQNSYITNEAKMMLSRRRLALMMIIISILFAICWLPYYILNILMVFSNRISKQVIPLYPFALLLGHSNSAQNPILYCFMHRKFKECIVRIVKCQCSKIRFERQITISKGYSNQMRGGADAPFLPKQDSVPLEHQQT
ncbi:gastrin/cholecystokinin type B receptor [Patella vulgata]|uniref:gastrin/cholecystokinin type B receptor n=1 Tax=Patella vulgata TaxID=6465 RepID=UPI00218052A5|nr:gastrin/cholecystokinin type B receptor [Patella vulgata]